MEEATVRGYDQSIGVTLNNYHTSTTENDIDDLFAFILSITEVNMFLAYRYFVWCSTDYKQPTFLQFRKQLAKALIYNEHLPNEEEVSPERRCSKRQRAIVGHHKETAPLRAKSFVAGRWDTTAKDKYQRYTCKTPDCTVRCRTYCACAPGHWLCDLCVADHFIAACNNDDSL